MDVGKREDRLLDKLSFYVHNRDATKAWLELYAESSMIDPQVAAHLYEVLMGLDTTTPGQVTEAVTADVVDAENPA